MIDSVMDFLASKLTEIFIVTMFGLAFLAMAYDDMCHADAEERKDILMRRYDDDGHDNADW